MPWHQERSLIDLVLQRGGLKTIHTGSKLILKSYVWNIQFRSAAAHENIIHGCLYCTVLEKILITTYVCVQHAWITSLFVTLGHSRFLQH